MGRMGKAVLSEQCVQPAAASFLFQGIEEARIREALTMDGVCVKRFPAGAELVFSRKDRRQLGILVSGEARVYRQAGTARVLINVLKSGDMTGAASLFSADADFTPAVIAKGPLCMLLFDEEAVESLLQSDFRFARNYIVYLSERIRFPTGRIQSVASPTAEEKLLAYLRQQAADGRRELTVSMTGLSQTLSMSRASLYRAMDALERKGLVLREGKTVFLLEGSGC